jgi:hypothetical protein
MVTRSPGHPVTQSNQPGDWVTIGEFMKLYAEKVVR